MNLINLNPADLVGAVLGFLLTISVFSYVWGDNLLFRLATNIFIGVAAGYVSVVTFYNVILPQLVFPFMGGAQGEKIIALLYLLPSFLLLTKISPRLARVGNPVMAILVGIGAATAIGGAVIGTIFPQVATSINIFDLQTSAPEPAWQQAGNALILLLGTLTTLIYFHFGARPGPEGTTQRANWIEALGWVGQVFIAITFGALFAGVYAAALSALIERLAFVWNLLEAYLIPLFTSA
jgi:hypothetical protein